MRALAIALAVAVGCDGDDDDMSIDASLDATPSSDASPRPPTYADTCPVFAGAYCDAVIACSSEPIDRVDCVETATNYCCAGAQCDGVSEPIEPCLDAIDMAECDALIYSRWPSGVPACDDFWRVQK